MTSIETINGTTTVKGDLSFDTVTSLFEQNLEADDAEIKIDLAQAGRVDSAGVALLVEWASRAKAQGKSVILQNVPEDAATLIRMGGIESMLGMAEHNAAE